MTKNTIHDEKLIRVAFHSIPGLGSGRLRHLIAVFGSAFKAWQASEKDLKILGGESWVNTLIQKRSQLDLIKVERELDQKEIQTVIPEEQHYPVLLRELADAPPLLYYKGNLGPDERGIAIVGSRKSTPYGRAAAESLGKAVAQQGYAVVSGLARGIDTAAHKGALAGKGKTWAILGSGLDYIYPSENKKLAEQILLEGALISEFAPGVPPEPQFFPMRNRLISGVSEGVVVVEAALRSGALITVDFALEQGREVFAVPGPIFSEQSKGCHQLLRQGATLVEGAEDILSELSGEFRVRVAATGSKDLESVKQPGNLSQKQEAYSNEQLEILSLMSDLPLHIDQIVLQSSINPSQIALLLLELQLSGEIEQLSGQRYVLAHKC